MFESSNRLQSLFNILQMLSEEFCISRLLISPLPMICVYFERFLIFFSFFNSKEIKLSISKSNTPISRKKRNSTFFVRSSHDTNNTQTHFYVIFQPPKLTKKIKKKLVLALKYCPPHYTRVYFKIDGQIFGEGSRRLIARVSVQFHTRATYVRGGRRGVRWGRSLFLTDEARSVEKENAVGWSPPGSTKLGDLSSRNSGPSLRFKRLLPSLPPLSIFRGEPAPRVATNLRIRDTKTAWISRSLFFRSDRVKFSCEKRENTSRFHENLKLTCWI